MSENDNNPMKEMFTAMQEAAAGLHEMFLSLTGAGFTEEQAMSVINNMIAAGLGGQ